MSVSNECNQFPMSVPISFIKRQHTVSVNLSFWCVRKTNLMMMMMMMMTTTMTTTMIVLFIVLVQNEWEL